MTLSITAALLGAIVAGSIFYLVRRDHLHGKQAAWWLVVAVFALALGLVPSLVDRLGVLFGVHYPPMLLVVLAIIAVLIKLLQTDIELARKERRLRRLTQKMAMLEYELAQLQGSSVDTASGAGSAESSASEDSPDAAGHERRRASR